VIGHRPISCTILLAMVLGGCSKGGPQPASQAPSQAQQAAPQASVAPTAPPPTAPGPAVSPALASIIKTEDTNTIGVAADVTECSRKEGVLSVKVRFRNTTDAKKHFAIIDGRNYEKYYLTAGSKKYFILKDSEGTYLTPQGDGFGSLGVDLDGAGQYTWWAKFPAPPAEVKEVTLYMPVAAPLEDIPISGQ
jgi:hypothetical protein